MFLIVADTLVNPDILEFKFIVKVSVAETTIVTSFIAPTTFRVFLDSIV